MKKFLVVQYPAALNQPLSLSLKYSSSYQTHEKYFIAFLNLCHSIVFRKIYWYEEGIYSN